ncbi:SAV_915 family protein [Streptomyces wedmorensis]|uniref:SAV_915 family protein n=1 Tax=Streptomyces wedmorensis TaxID=43759 RepID=UPI00342F8CE8
MSAALYGDEPEPGEQLPAGRLCVPVRPGAGGCVTRLFRTPVGGRTAVAFTGPVRLRAVLGAAQPWIVLAEPALRALMEPLGVRELRIDPVLTARTSEVPVDARPSEVPVDARTPEVPFGGWPSEVPAEGTPVGVADGVTAAGAESLPGSRPLAGIAN